MAGELQVRSASLDIVYAQLRSPTGTIWNGTAYEAYLTANIATYAIAMTEQGTASQLFTGTFPPTVPAGIYRVTYWTQEGGAPVETDVFRDVEILEWTGSVLLPRAAWALVDVVDVGDGREWTVERDGRVAPTLVIAATDSVTLSMDFSRFVNPETSLATATSVVDQSANALTTSNVILSGDKRKLHFDVAAADLAVSTSYLMRCTGTTTDGDTISADGPLKTRA